MHFVHLSVCPSGYCNTIGLSFPTWYPSLGFQSIHSRTPADLARNPLLVPLPPPCAPAAPSCTWPTRLRPARYTAACRCVFYARMQTQPVRSLTSMRVAVYMPLARCTAGPPRVCAPRGLRTTPPPPPHTPPTPRGQHYAPLTKSTQPPLCSLCVHLRKEKKKRR